jgi:hypothetical protein
MNVPAKKYAKFISVITVNALLNDKKERIIKRKEIILVILSQKIKIIYCIG